MGKIDTSEWKEFQIKDLFETQKKGNKLQVPTGASVPVQDLLEDGATPRITVTGSNNGIFGFYDYCGKNIADYRVFNNFVSVSFLGTVFYQEGDATLDMKVHCLKPKGITLNKYTGRFLVGAIRASLRESTYSDQISSSILPEMSIKLPATPDGVPDWAYMESYMANLETKVAESLTLLQTAKDAEKKKVDTREWGEFKFGNLFDLHGIKQAKSQKLIPTVELSDGIPCVPYIVQSQFNNMVGRYVDKQWLIENNEPPVEGNALVLGVTLNACSYQPEEFGASQVITARSPCLNKNNGFFIAAIVRKRIEQFDYKEKPSFEKYRALKIMLPIDKTGQPDWAYMEEYMRKVEEKAKNVLNHFEKDRNGV